MEAVGQHLLVDLKGCHQISDNKDFILRVLGEAAGAAGATVLSNGFHKFDPQGLTAYLILSESHISIHTYPEVGCAFIDIFTCGENCTPENAIPVLIKYFSPKELVIKNTNRG